MTKGKLLTTPSSMLKMVLPLTTRDFNSDRKDVEPLALLVHPQQPLSYLERLIQSELPTMKDKDGKEKIPSVWFRAEDSMRDQGASTGGDDAGENKEDMKRRKGNKSPKENEENEETKDLEDSDTTMIDGESVKTGKISPQKQRHSPGKSAALRGGHGEGGVESYSGLGQDAKPSSKSDDNDSSKSPATDADRASSFVRWSSSTEIGDFIRDAARARYFAVEIEGAPHPILVGAPSFRDRTYYLRMRLRQRSREIARMADVKRECDAIAERGAKRVAWAGGSALVGYWWVVYIATFRSDLGWDVMEPVTVSSTPGAIEEEIWC
jgi:calcium uniporter protein, mitochondrial